MHGAYRKERKTMAVIIVTIHANTVLQSIKVG